MLLPSSTQPSSPAQLQFSYSAQTKFVICDYAIEAGIKEEKGVFTLKRHLVRSPIGMQLQEQFALFGANFVRWAATWIKDCLTQSQPAFLSALDQVKTLVRVVAHTRARWVRNGCGNFLCFETGPFAGTIICLAGLVALQLVLPLFNFAPS